MTAFMEKIYKYDSIISYRLCDFRYCRWFSALMVISSKLGDGWIWIFLSLCLIPIGGIIIFYYSHMGSFFGSQSRFYQKVY